MTDSHGHTPSGANLLTLAKGVKKYVFGASHEDQTETVRVNLQRDDNGKLVLYIDLSRTSEPVEIIRTGDVPQSLGHHFPDATLRAMARDLL